MDFGFLTMPALALSAVLGYSVFFDSSVVLFRDVHVPNAVADDGFTPRVVASRLANEVRAINRAARTAKEQQRFGLIDDDAAVKVVSERFEFLHPLKATQEALGFAAYDFSGEMVKLERDYEFIVRGDDRKQGRSITASARGPRPEELIRPVAIDLVRAIDPYVVASYYFETTRDSGGKDYSVALRELRNCLITMPREERHWAVNLQGQVLLQQGRFDDAMMRFNEARALKPDFVLPIYNQGLVFAAKGKHEEAMARYKEVLTLDADRRSRFPHTYTQWGVSLAATGRPEEALTMFQRAEQADPSYPDLYNAWGRFLRDQNKIVEAREMFQKAVDRAPERVEFRDNLKAAMTAPAR